MSVVSMGELLIDFVALESGVTVGEASGFQKAPGGAPANVAVAVARMLLQAGAAATINAVDDERNSALHLAAWNGSKDCVALLLAAGAAPNLKNKDKKTPKMLAAESPNPSCFPLGLPGEF